MPVMKLTVEAAADTDSSHLIAAISDVKFSCGGVVKLEGRVLTHYTEHSQLAVEEWTRRGFRVVGSATVELGPEGVRKLLADLEAGL